MVRNGRTWKNEGGKKLYGEHLTIWFMVKATQQSPSVVSSRAPLGGRPRGGSHTNGLTAWFQGLLPGYG